MVDCWKKNRRLNLVMLYFNIFPVTFWNSLLTFFLSVIYFITFPPDFLPQSRHCMCRGQGAGCRWLSRWRLNITNIPSSLEAGQPDTPPNRETAFTINGDPVWWLWKGIFQVSSPLPSSPPPLPRHSPPQAIYSPSRLPPPQALPSNFFEGMERILEMKSAGYFDKLKRWKRLVDMKCLILSTSIMGATSGIFHKAPGSHCVIL